MFFFDSPTITGLTSCKKRICLISHSEHIIRTALAGEPQLAADHILHTSTVASGELALQYALEISKREGERLLIQIKEIQGRLHRAGPGRRDQK